MIFRKEVDIGTEKGYNKVDSSNAFADMDAEDGCETGKLEGGKGTVEFVSILDREESPYREKMRPAFFQDLNLDQVIERIHLDWGEAVSSYYCYFPANADCEDYRREIFADIRNQTLYDILCGFCERMKLRRKACVQKEEVKSPLQRAVWHLREVGCYCDAFGQLWDEIEHISLKSRGLQAFREYLHRCLSEKAYIKMRTETAELLEELAAFRLVLTYENDKITVLPGETTGSYDDFLADTFPGHGKHLVSPFAADVELAGLEEELLKAFRKRNPDFFWHVEDFYKEYALYTNQTLLRFASEIGYYLSFRHFELKMEERGFAFAEPVMIGEETGQNRDIPPEVPAGDACREMRACGLYDLALACAGKSVVSNDLVFYPEEKFFILTGPNQGGKTTFARSLGQMVYFAKMGLDVPAVSAEIYRFTDILTHFSVEESVETGRGKLQEELERLANIMTAVQKEQAFVFVVINELFTTAANYDACIMGRRVIDYFLEHGCRGIYVTHLGELAREDSRLVSLRAMLDERGERTFRIARSAEEISAGADSLVSRHGLTYEQLKERLA